MVVISKKFQVLQASHNLTYPLTRGLSLGLRLGQINALKRVWYRAVSPTAKAGPVIVSQFKRHQSHSPGSPTTIFYILLYESPIFFLIVRVYHPKGTSIFVDGGWLPGLWWRSSLLRLNPHRRLFGVGKLLFGFNDCLSSSQHRFLLISFLSGTTTIHRTSELWGNPKESRGKRKCLQSSTKNAWIVLNLHLKELRQHSRHSHSLWKRKIFLYLSSNHLHPIHTFPSTPDYRSIISTRHLLTLPEPHIVPTLAKNEGDYLEILIAKHLELKTCGETTEIHLIVFFFEASETTG